MTQSPEPSEPSPKPGLRGRAVRAFKATRDIWTITEARNLGLISAGVAFFSMLAIFPAMAAVVAIWGFFADPVVVAEQVATAADYLPAQAFSILEAQIQGLVAADSRQLGWATALSASAALWSARAGMAALVRGINTIFGVDHRGGLKHQIVSLVLTLALVGVALAALATGVIVPVMLAFARLGPFEAYLVWLTQWSVGPAIIVLGIGLVYRYGPNLPAPRPRLLSPGVVVAVALWLSASQAFSIYLTNFSNYNQIYGSIGAVVALLMWFYLSAYAILLGAAVNAVLRDRAQ